jgi:hypothetical protein
MMGYDGMKCAHAYSMKRLLVICVVVMLASCKQAEQAEAPYDSNDSSSVVLPTGFTGATHYAASDSLFDDYISDILDKSALKLESGGKILCIERSSPGRSMLEAIGNGIHIRLKNEGEEQVSSTLFIDGQELKLDDLVHRDIEGDSAHQLYRLNCESIRRFTFGRRRYTYLNLGYNRCNGTACSVAYHVLYDHEAGKANVFRTSGMADYFMLGNVNGDDQLDLVSFSEVNEGGFTELNVQTLRNGSFVALTNPQGEALRQELQLLYNDGGLYQIDIWDTNL